ncbi:MAG TPA: hypothetical protein VD867_00055 [Burkholderiales bacterium]|nr:hypothetical protein [Burkholderiales bacterium]
MHIVVYILGGLYLVLAAGLAFTYYRGRQPGIALMAVAYGFSGLLAIGHVHWWPLLVGFLLAWVFRFMGLDPSVPREPR